MDIGYIRLSKTGPTEEEQLAALAAAGVAPDLGETLYVDPLPKKGRQASFGERDNAIRCVRKGDRLVIHSAPRLGSTEAELRDAVSAVSANGAVIYDCAAKATIRHHPDAGRLLAWAKAGAAQAAQERLAKARGAITRRGAPAKALDGKRLAAVKAAWEARSETGASVKALAKQFGVSARTLYREAEQGKWRMPDAR